VVAIQLVQAQRQAAHERQLDALQITVGSGARKVSSCAGFT
jgi:hypothetical protein